MSILRIYTDGACKNNQGDNNVGGYGVVLEYNESIKELKAIEKNTTNNRMELKAVICAFKALNRKGLDIEVYSDSSYVTNCFREKWYINWQKNGWRNSKKEPVENKELWEELLDLTKEHNVKFLRVKGHVDLNKDLKETYKKFEEWNGSYSFEDYKHIQKMNNRCDELANMAIDENR